jgi:hypothetical protein
MSAFQILADEETSKRLDVAMVMLTPDAGRGEPRKGIILTRELLVDAFGGDANRAAEVIRSGIVDHEAMRRIDSPDRLSYQPQAASATESSRWHLAVFSRDDLGLFEGPVRSG